MDAVVGAHGGSVPARRRAVIRGFIYLRDVFTLRAAIAADADRLARAVSDGLEDYRSFAPVGWEPPAEEDPATLLARDDVVCVVAEHGAGLAGQVTVQPAAHAARPVADAGLAHFRNLFVRADLWGSGLARTLHEAALDAARGRGFSAMRLFCAAGQSRARRFYEREGWEVVGEPWHEAALGLDMVEYRRAL
jgi:GNAT superfamily N-acetyltransferase